MVIYVFPVTKYHEMEEIRKLFKQNEIKTLINLIIIVCTEAILFLKDIAVILLAVLVFLQQT